MTITLPTYYVCTYLSSVVSQLLTGHQDNAEFALAMCPSEPFVLSGGDILN